MDSPTERLREKLYAVIVSRVDAIRIVVIKFKKS